MADKAISDLTQALQITNEDQFVLEQGGEAKMLKGETLLKFVTLSVVSVTVTTLPAGSSATATYDKSTGTLALGIPQGSKGDTGATGATGPTNVLTIGSVTSGKVASATITGEAPNQVLNLVLEKGEQGEQGKQGIQGEIGPQGNPGADAPTITGITIRQSDYHLIVTLSDGTSYDAGYCRGASGAGTGDMLASVYDPNNKHQDIFAYVDNAIKDVKVTTDATPTQGSANPVQSGGVFSELSNKADSNTVTKHITNKIIHITEEERTSWNDAIVLTSVTNRLNSSATLRSIAYGNGMFVVIDYNSATINYSVDGITWLKATAPITDNWMSVTYGNGKFVAVGSTEKTIYSEDGINWTVGNLPADTGSFHRICYGAGKFVTVSNTGRVCYSTDGINWNVVAIKTSVKFYALCYANEKFIGLGYGSTTVISSVDGISWTIGSLPVSASWRDVCYGAGKFVGVSQASGGKTVYSVDGVTWLAGKNIPSNANGNWLSLVYFNNGFIAPNYGAYEVAYSIDGITWETAEFSYYWSYTMTCTDDRVVVIPVGWFSIVSYDGITWFNQVTKQINTKTYIDNIIANIFTSITGYDESKTQSLQNVSGTIKWVTST